MLFRVCPRFPVGLAEAVSSAHVAARTFLWDHMASPHWQIQADRLSCALALAKAELLQNLFWRSSNFSSSLPVLEELGCWMSKLLAQLLTSFSGTVTAVWAVSKAWRCMQAWTPVHNCAQNLLLQDWNRLWKSQATQKPVRASAFSCCE